MKTGLLTLFLFICSLRIQALDEKPTCPNFSGVYEFPGEDGVMIISFKQEHCKSIQVGHKAMSPADAGWKSITKLSLNGEIMKLKSSHSKDEMYDQLGAKFINNSLEIKEKYTNSKTWIRTVYSLKPDGNIFFHLPDEKLPQGDIAYEGVRKTK